MSRREEISKGNLALVAAINNIKTLLGDNSTLSTTNKSNLVAAINEVLGVAVNAANSGGAQIDDSVINLSNVWSSQKTSTEIIAQIALALEGEDLSDLAAEIAALAQADNGLVSATASQSFSAIQIAQAQENINAADKTEVGDTDYDFEAEILANLSV